MNTATDAGDDVQTLREMHREVELQLAEWVELGRILQTRLADLKQKDAEARRERRARLRLVQ